MRWELETWRKLYTRITPSWAALPALARGLGSELLKYCDDDGRIPLGIDEDAPDTVVRVIGAHRGEQKAVRAYVLLLVQDGYLVLEHGAVVIRNLKEAQEVLSPAARQARYRARNASRKGNAMGNGKRDETSPDSDVARNGLREAKRYQSEIDAEIPLTPASGGTDFVTGDPEAVRPSRANGTNPRAVAATLKPGEAGYRLPDAAPSPPSRSGAA